MNQYQRIYSILIEAGDKPPKKLTAAQKKRHRKDIETQTALGRQQRKLGRPAVAIDTFNRVEALQKALRGN